MKTIILIISLLCSLVFAGCAHLPNAKITYYLPTSDVSFKIIRTVSCDANDNPKVAHSVIPTLTHSADLEKPETIYFKKLTSNFADTDVKLDFYDDGRLKGINAVNTGQGETILKTVISIAETVVLGAAFAPSETFPQECAFIKKNGADKPLTVTYEGKLDINGTGNITIIPADVNSDFYEKHVRSAIGQVCAVITKITKHNQYPPGTSLEDIKYWPVAYVAGNDDDNTLIYAQQPALASIKVTTGSKDKCDQQPMWDGILPLAQYGSRYPIPIPAPKLFGKQTFAVTFDGSGALTTLQYAKNTGAGQVLNLVSPAYSALQGDTMAEKTNKLKAEGDLIATQQRLIKCEAKPDDCK